MAEKIELQIVADNADYIQKTKQVEEATKSMQRSVQDGDKRQKGLIEDQIAALKELEKARIKANNEKDLIKINQRIAEGTKNLKEFQQMGVKVDDTIKKQSKSTDSLWSGVKKLGAAYLTVNGAIKIFKAVMDSTQSSGDFLRRTIGSLTSSLGELWRSIASGNLQDLGKRMKEAGKAGGEYADTLDYIGDRGRELIIREGERKIQLAELAKIYRNTALSHAEQAAAAEKYIALTEEGLREGLELAELKLKAELKLASQQTAAAGEAGRLTEEEIQNNLRRAQYLQQNMDAINTYRRALSNLAAEEAKRAEASISPEGIPLPGVTGPDPKLISLYKQQIADTSDEIKQLSEEMKGWNLVTDEQRTKIVNAINDINAKRAEAVSSTIRANIKMEMANKDAVESDKKAEDERLKNLEKFIQATSQLRDEYDKAQIEQLTGTERIRAEQEFELRQVQLLEDHLSELGTLTEEHYKYLDGLRASANLRAERAIRVEQQTELDYWNDFYDESIAERMKFYDFREELDVKTAELAGELSGKKELEIQAKWLQARIDLIKNSKNPELQARAEIMEADLALIQQKIDGTEAGETLWDKLGFNDEQGEAIEKAVSTTVDALDQIFDARVQDAERTRELLDTQISETQRALEAEMELMKAGYASNVDAKRKELEELQKQREKALKQEEAAIKAKRQLETVTQTVSLISAAAETFKAFPGPLLPIAIATVAAMFAAFATAKIKAAAAAKLAEGGVGTETGIIKGRSHREGGERFLDHVEVERGEMWGVLSKKATAKYGKQFNQIVTSFNKDQIPVAQMADVHNNILVDVSQTNERLDRVQSELIKLNRHFGVSAEVFETPTARIIKRGNKTRIIRK